MGAEFSQPVAKECKVCCCVKAGTDFVLATAACKHQPSTCLECLQKYVKCNAVDKGGIADMVCLTADCGAVVSVGDVHRIAGKAMANALNANLFKQWLSSQPNFRWAQVA
jgi:hypothetical protein